MRPSQIVAFRPASGKKHYEVSDLVIDNCCSYGDTELSCQALEGKFTSTPKVIGADVVSTVVAETIEYRLERSNEFFISAKLRK